MSANGNSEATAPAAATNGNAERAAGASASAPSSSSSPIDAMVAGQSFLSFAPAATGDAAAAAGAAPRSVFVWYDASSSRFGMLYQTDRLSDAEQEAGAVQQRPKDERTGVPMHRVSDVYLGKRAAEFSSPAASSYPSSQCFSIVSRDRSLHLVAPSEPIRAVWLQGVKEVFAKQKEAAAAKKKASASATAPLQPQTQTQQESAQTAPAAVGETAAPAAAATAPVASTTTAAAAAAAPVAPPNVLAEGRRYRSVVLDGSAPGGATATEIFLWHDPTEGKLGTLHWCVPSSSEGSVTKTKSAGKSMAVKTIRDVMLGKQTAELRSEFARDVPSSSAFSLMVDKEKGEGLHLIAASDAERNATLATIKGFWATSASGKKSKNNTATAGAIATAAAAAAPAQAAAPAAATTEPASASAAALTASDQAALADAARKVTEQPSTLEAVPAPEPAAAPASGVVRVHLGGLDAAAPAPAETAPAPAPAAEALVSPSPTSADKEAAAALSAHVASDPQRNIDTMLGGCVFRCHDLTPPASASAPAPVRDVFVFLGQGQDDPADGAIGTIYWNEGSAADKTRSSERALNLASVKDIFVGKHAWKAAGAPFSAQSAALPSSRALSVVAAGGRALHLEAPSDEARARWATGIRNCFELAHRKAEATRKAQRSASPPAAGASTNGAGGDQRDAADLLSRGSDFTSHLIRPDSSLAALPVFVWYEPASADTGKMGSVFWCERGQRNKVSGQSIPLHKVSDVFLGKHATLKSRPEMSSVRTAHMFTLATRSSAVHLEARDAAQRAEWIAAIKGLFINSGKKVDSNGAPARAAGAGPNFPEIPMSPRNGAGSSGAASPRSLAQEGQNPLPVVATPIGEGADFEAWSFVLEDSSASSSAAATASSGQQQKRRLQCKQVHVWFEHDPAPLGALYWSDASAPRRVRVPGAILPLSEVSDVFIGKLVDEFSHADANHIPADRCLSLRSASNPAHNLNLVAPSAQAQRRWVRGLKQQFSASPDTVIETRPLGSAAQEAATSPRSARAIQLKLDALAAGHDATLLDEAGHPRPVTVWLDRAEARAGTIYFSDRVEGASQELQQRKKDEARKIPVHTISDVYVGKKTAAFKSASASSIPSNTAFSVGNKASSAGKASEHKRLLNAYTRTPAERAMIIQGIEAAIIAAGTPVREYVHGQPKQSGARHVQGNAVESNPGALARTSTMQQGTTVLLHSGSGSTAGQATFLWYEPGVGKQGAFRWTAVPDQGKGVAHRRFEKGHELKLQHISDVMSGRQSAALRGAEATRAGARNANCFSLHTRSGAGLHVQMATPAERDAWLAALRSVFALTHKRIVEGAGAPGAAAASKLADGALVDTWFGRGRVAGATRGDGITRVDVGDTRCYFNAESIRPVPLLYTPFGPGVAPRGAGAAVRQDGIRRVELPWATAFLNEESCSDRDPASSSSGSGAGALHQSRDASVAFLSNGALFVRITSRGTSQTVWASLNASAGAGGLGVLEFRHESSGPLLGSVAMASMCDLLVGRQTAVLRAVGPATAPDSRAFTLVAERGAVSVDLVAPRDQDRTDWIYALFNVLASSGRRVTQQRGDASPSSPAASPVSPPLRATGGRGAAGRRYSFSRPNGVPTFGESSRILARGVVCSILVVRPADHTRESALRSIVWLDVEEDRLYWMPLPLAPASGSSSAPEPEQAVWRQKHPLRSLPLSAVSDCYYNKKTAAFAERAFVGTPKHLCLSVAARPRPATAGGEEVEWNIVCPGREDRDEIFFALQGLLTSRDRAEKVQAALLAHNSPTSSAHSVAPSSSEEQWSPRGAAAPAAAAAPAPVSPAAAAAAKVPVSGRDEQGYNVLSRGVMLTLWEGEGPAVTSSRAFLFHEYDSPTEAADGTKAAKYGSLYWNAGEGDRTRSSARRFPLHTVRDVFCGKSTPTTRSPALEQVPKGQVVSLVAAPGPDPTQQPQALHMQVASAAHRAAFVNALKQFWGKVRPQSPGANGSSASAVAAVPPPADFSPRASGAAGSPSSAIGSSFAFGSGAAAASSSSSAAAAAPAALEVRQPSALVSGPPLSAEFLAAACSAPSRGALLLPPAPALAFIQAGSAFVASSTAAGSLPAQEVDAFYVAAAGFDAPFGTIYTCPRGQRLMDAEADPAVTALAVHRIEAVKVSAAGLGLSVETSTQRLELQAASLDVVAGWLAGLQHVLAAGGFRITRGGPSGATEAQGEDVVFRIDDRTAEAINSPAAVLSLPGPVLRKVASEGLAFNALFPQYGGGAGKISRTALTLFEAEGSLWLAAHGTLARDPSDESRKFPLHELLRVGVGGRLGALACSVQSRENYIDLEAPSLGDLALFLGVLTHLLQGLETPSAAGAGLGVAVIPEKESSTPSKRVYNLAPRRVARTAASAGPTHAAGCSPVDVRGAVSPRSEAEARANFEAVGAAVTAYTLKEGGVLQHKELILWLCADPESEPSDSAGAQPATLLCWGSPFEDEYVPARMPDPSGDNLFPLDEVLSAQVGKLTPALLALGPEEHVPAAECFSVTFTAGTAIEGVARSAAEARAIVQAVLSRNPKSLVVKQ